MMMVALIMRPWLKMMNMLGVRPKVLADDVLIMAEGTHMLSKSAKALSATHQYLHDLGAKIAPAKSFNFASTEQSRRWLADTLWPIIGTSIEVCKDIRYLGAQLSTTLTQRNTTLVTRWEKALAQLKKLKFLHADQPSKIKAVLVKVFAGLFYGVEGNDLTSRQVASVSAAVLDVFRSRNDVHDADWFYVTLNDNTNRDLDPVTQILTRRCLQLRRAICKRPHLKQSFAKAIRLYAKASTTGAAWFHDLSKDRDCYPDVQPHPSKGGSDAWKKDVQSYGPVGLLIQSVMRCGATIDDNFCIRQRHEQQVDIVNVPYQYLGMLVS